MLHCRDERMRGTVHSMTDERADAAVADDRVDEGLEHAVARRVRVLRTARGLSAAQLAAAAGISPAMVSRIESASISSSLTTIQRLAAALEVPVASLFRGAEARPSAIVVRDGQGAPVVRSGTARGHAYRSLGSILSASGPSLEPLMVEFSADATELPIYEHAGVEFLLMLDGALEYQHGDRRWELRAGDSVLLDAEAPHGPTRVIEPPVRYLLVNPSGI